MNDNTTRAENAMQRAARLALARARLADRQRKEPGSVPRYESRDARLAQAAKRNRQRLDHLVMGQERPVEKVIIGKRKGRSRPTRKAVPVTLEPGVEEAVALRERWSHKQGTPQTLDYTQRTHQGALAQLHANGTIDNEQLEWAAQIANVHRSIESDVTIGNASLEARVDCAGSGRHFHGESVRRVRFHVAYGLWRALLPQPKRLVLDMLVGEPIGFSVAAARHHVHKRRARRLLLEAINRWPDCVARACRQVSAEDVAAANMAA